MASCTCFSSQITLTTFIFFILSSASYSSSTTRTTTAASRTPVGRFTKIYAFGDSFTDTGNTNSSTGPNLFSYVSNLPYGNTFFRRPTNRYCNGRLVIDFVAEKLSLPYLPPYRIKGADTSHGANFAVAGSTAIEHSFFVKNNLTLDLTPVSLQTQLIWFNEFLESKGCGGAISGECRAAFDDALFWVGEIGINDYAYLVGSEVSSTAVQELAIERVTGFLQELLKKGAKYVVVQGLPLTGCLPLTLELTQTDDRDELGCSKSQNMMSYMHNSHLQAKLKDLRRQYPHAVIVYADYLSAYREVMKNTHKYGFTEPFKVCCGSGGGTYNFDPFATCGSPAAVKACPNPAQFINWDGVHLTEAMYKMVAYLLLHGGFCHPSFNALINSRSLGS